MNYMLTIYTMGHSTHPIEEFIEILRAYEIDRLVDIRTIPKSAHNPQFNREELSACLHNRHISYGHLKELGGLRHAKKDSLNTAWQNSSFRGYADYMQTGEFEIGVDKLIALAKEKLTAIMCAEAVPWRCHRSLLSDALVARGIQVVDIFSRTNAKPHLLSDLASVHGTNVIYPAKVSQVRIPGLIYPDSTHEAGDAGHRY